jgi:hypothetical protein
MFSPMPKSAETKSTANPEDEDLPYTSTMRLFGGVAWGTIMSLLVGSTLVLIPQVPRSWLWGVLPFWLGISLLGIALQWNIARGNCPKCGLQLTVPPQGKRCPQCRTYLKASDRQIVRS